MKNLMKQYFFALLKTSVAAVAVFFSLPCLPSLPSIYPTVFVQNSVQTHTQAIAGYDVLRRRKSETVKSINKAGVCLSVYIVETKGNDRAVVANWRIGL